MINAILVDDETHCLDTLSILIKDYCPDVEILEQCSSAKKALVAIEKYQPALVFLDIEMPVMNGFELLEQFKDIHFSVIFTTSYDQYAIKAIRFSALDYLLKPIDRAELIQAVAKVSKTLKNPTDLQLELLLQKLNMPKSYIKRMALPTMEGLEMVEIDSIISCSSDGNYTNFFLKNNKKVTASRTLKDVEELLSDYSFLRVHNSYLVNINEINKYIRGEGGYLVMSNGANIDVSRTRKEMLLQKLRPNRL